MSEPEGGSEGSAFAALKARAEALEEQIRQVEAGAVRRSREAELQTEAARAGIIDIDGLRLIDLEALTSPTNPPFDAVEIVGRLRRDKPWLFGASNSSSTQAAPPTTPSRTRLAMDMSVDEWRTARALLLRRR